jgi:hypothetical protein
MIPETKLIQHKTRKKEAGFVTGYFITLAQLVRLCRDFSADCFDGFVSNDEAYIKSRLNKME